MGQHHPNPPGRTLPQPGQGVCDEGMRDVGDCPVTDLCGAPKRRVKQERVPGPQAGNRGFDCRVPGVRVGQVQNPLASGGDLNGDGVAGFRPVVDGMELHLERAGGRSTAGRQGPPVERQVGRRGAQVGQQTWRSDTGHAQVRTLAAELAGSGDVAHVGVGPGNSDDIGVDAVPLLADVGRRVQQDRLAFVDDGDGRGGPCEGGIRLGRGAIRASASDLGNPCILRAAQHDHMHGGPSEPRVIAQRINRPGAAIVVLRQRDVAATVGGAMVGAGIFIAPERLIDNGAPPLLILGLFAAAGIVAVFGAFTLVRLAQAMPGNGGPYLYLRVLHPRLPSLFNWSRFWVMQTGALAILSLIAAQFALQTFGYSHWYAQAVLAMLLLAGAAAINARGLRTGARFQLATTALKFAAILAVSIGIFTVGDAANLRASRGTANLGLGSWMLTVVFAFGGWTQVTFLAGETRGDLKRPVVGAILGVTALYILAVAAMLLAPVGPGPLALAAAESVFGASGARIMSAVIAVTVLGTLHTMTLTGPRLYEAAAARGDWWRPFARRNHRDAPGMAILYQAEWAAVLIVLSLLARNAYDALIGGISTAIWLFHVATALAWFRVRRGSFVPPAIFLAASSFVVGVAFVQDISRALDGAWGQVTSLYALLIIASGLPLAWRGSRSPPTAPDAPRGLPGSATR